MPRLYQARAGAPFIRADFSSKVFAYSSWPRCSASTPARSTSACAYCERLIHGQNTVDPANDSISAAANAARLFLFRDPWLLDANPRSAPMPAPAPCATFPTGITSVTVNTMQRKNQATNVTEVWRSTAPANLVSRRSSTHNIPQSPYPTPDRPTPP